MVMVKPVRFELPPDIVIFGSSDLMREVRPKVERIMDAVVPVLIRGESGTGKEVIAKLAEHESTSGSDRNGAQASPFRLSAIPSDVEVASKGTEPLPLKSLIQSVKSETERNAIAAALEKTQWNRKAAARLLSVSYRTLLYKIDLYHMRALETKVLPFRR